jgi:hypothetical protein
MSGSVRGIIAMPEVFGFAEVDHLRVGRPLDGLPRRG